MAKNDKFEKFVVFDTVTEDGEPLKLRVIKPSPHVQSDAQLIWNTAWNKAIVSKAPLRSRVDKILREQGLWDDDMEKEFQELQQKLLSNERRLKAGGIKKSEAKNIALEMIDLRARMQNLLVERHRQDGITAEAQADNMRFNYFVAVCTVYEESDKKSQHYFKDLDDYLKRSEEDAAVAAATHLAQLYHGLDPDFRKKLPENKFLLEYGFVNEDLNFINKDGHLVDRDGRLVKIVKDADGNDIVRYVDEAGNPVDMNGNRISDDGEYVVDFQPFLEDDE